MERKEINTETMLINLLLLGICLLILLVFVFCLKLANAGKGDVVTVLSDFIKARIENRPLSVAEIKAIIYFVIITAILSAGIITLVLKYRTFIARVKAQRMIKSRHAGEYGTAEWGSLLDLKPVLGDDGVVIGANKRLYKMEPVRLSSRSSYEHVAVIGPTGCGKSTCFFIPNLLLLPSGVSAVVTDPKGELERETAGHLQKRGWHIMRFAPMSPEISFGYDPLRCIRSEIEISDIADIVLKNGYDPEGRGSDTQWINFSAPLLEAVMHAARQEYGAHATVERAVKYVTEATEEMRAERFKRLGGHAREKYMIYLQSIESPETASSIRTVLTSAVRVFTRLDVKQVGQKQPAIDFAALRQRPTVLFVQIPERKAYLLKPLMATFFWQMLEHITDMQGNPVYFFLDEFPNIGKIPGFAEMAATLRSRRISLCVGLQGVEQLAREYSVQEQKDILNNLKTKIFFPGSSGDTGEYVSSIAGYSTIKLNESSQRVELLNAAELRTIPEGKVLVVTKNYNPVLLDVLHYSHIVSFNKGR